MASTVCIKVSESFKLQDGLHSLKYHNKFVVNRDEYKTDDLYAMNRKCRL